MKVCEERVQTGNFPRVPLEESVIAIVPKHQKNTLRATESIKRAARSPRAQVNRPTKHGRITSWRKQGLSVSPVSSFEMHKITQIGWNERSKLSGKRGLLFLAGSELGDCVEILSCSTFAESFLIFNRSYDYLESPLDSASLPKIERLIG